MPHIFLAGPIVSPEEESRSVAKFVFPLSKGLEGQGEECFWPRSEEGVSQVLAGVLGSIRSPFASSALDVDGAEPPWTDRCILQAGAQKDNTRPSPSARRINPGSLPVPAPQRPPGIDRARVVSVTLCEARGR